MGYTGPDRAARPLRSRTSRKDPRYAALSRGAHADPLTKSFPLHPSGLECRGGYRRSPGRPPSASHLNLFCRVRLRALPALKAPLRSDGSFPNSALLRLSRTVTVLSRKGAYQPRALPTSRWLLGGPAPNNSGLLPIHNLRSFRQCTPGLSHTPRTSGIPKPSIQ